MRQRARPCHRTAFPHTRARLAGFGPRRALHALGRRRLPPPTSMRSECGCAAEGRSQPPEFPVKQIHAVECRQHPLPRLAARDFQHT